MKEKKIEINRHGEILGTPPEVYAHENNKNEIDHGNVDKGDRKCETGNETNRNGFNKNSYTDSMDKKNNAGENVDMSGKKSHLYHNNGKNDELEQNIEKVNEDIHRTYYKNEYGGEAIDDSEDVHKHSVRKKNEIDFERFNANVDMYSEYDALSIYKNSKYKENDQQDTDTQEKINFDGKNSSNKMYQQTPIIDSNYDASRFQNITNGQHNTDMHEKAYNISNHPHIRYDDNTYDTNHASLSHSNRAYDHTNDKNKDYDNSGLQQNIPFNNANLNSHYSNSNMKIDGYNNEEQIGKSGRANDYKNPAMTRQDSNEYTGAKSSSSRRENTDYNANNVNRGAYDDTSQVNNPSNANYDKSVYDQTEMDNTQYNLTDFNSNGYNNGEYKNIPYDNTEYSNNEYDNTQFHNNDYAKPFNQAYNSASNFDNLRVKTSKYNESYDTTGQFNTYNPHYSTNSYNSQYPDHDPKNYEIQMFDKTQQAYDAENPYMYSYYDKGDQPLYVNVKQFTCIRKRKMRRDFLDTLMKQQSSGYLHESRHRHAMNRMRAPSGRFLTKEETAKMKKNQNDEHHEM